jgi:hypothetical protein
MVSREFRKYSHLVRWPDLKVVRSNSARREWHIDEPSLSCGKGTGITVISGERHIFKVWVSQSLESGKLYMLDHNGKEIHPDDICDACAGKVMKLLKWRSSEQGNLEAQQQESRDELEERDFRAKGLIE